MAILNPVPQNIAMSSRLRMLLQVLIFTFIGCGMALVILSRIETYHREQIYLATEAALPVHKIISNGEGVGKVDTKGWQTYRNEEYGFEFKYPKNMVIGDIKKSTDKSYVTLDLNVGNSDFWFVNISEIGSNNSSTRKQVDKNKIQLNEYTAWQTKGDIIGQIYFLETFLNNAGYTYDFQYWSKNEDNIPLYNKILSTFKFIK